MAFGLSINTSLGLYLSFALIRQKISERESCNTQVLKTEAHYISLVTTLEFLLLVQCCKKIHFPMDTESNGALPTLLNCSGCVTGYTSTLAIFHLFYLTICTDEQCSFILFVERNIVIFDIHIEKPSC